jgi:excisionase family DNA binding protein
VSSLKDWYRYVDSRARSRPENSEPSERDPQATDPNAPPAEPGAAAEPAVESAPGDAAAGEEGLDVWSGLFPQRPNPEEKPTTGPLKRPVSDRDEAPADLTFAQAPIDTPPAPAFQLPETQLEIPSFEEFVSPFTPEPPSAAAPSPAATPPAPAPAAPGAAPTASAAQPEAVVAASTPVSPETSAAEATASKTTAPSASLESAAPGGTTADPAHGVLEGQPRPAQAFMPGEQEPTSSSPVGTAESSQAPPPSPAAPDTGSPVLPQEAAPPTGTAAPTDETADEGQLPWRSPFRRPGPGHTVSSGAAPPRPAPAAPRAQPDRSASLEAALSTVEEQAIERSEPPPAAAERPVPGTAEWERERVERLARTFRETLQVLEQSRAGATDEAPAVESDPLHAAAVPESEEEVGLAGSTTSASILASLPPAAPAAPAQPVSETWSPFPDEAPPAAAFINQPVIPPVDEHRVAAAPPAVVPEPALTVEAAPTAASIAPAADALLAPSTQRPTPTTQRPNLTGAPPDVRQSIEEAALMRERLPQHIDMLLRIPTNEVAQNSYKSPFRESREELVRRLLDPQLTLEEAARVLGVCPTTVRRYTNRGMLHCHRTPGNQRRFRMSDVLQFLEQFGDRIDRAAEARQMEEAA